MPPPIFTEAEARNENVMSLRSIAVCQQVQALISLRQFSKLNFDYIAVNEMEATIEEVSVETLEE